MLQSVFMHRFDCIFVSTVYGPIKCAKLIWFDSEKNNSARVLVAQPDGIAKNVNWGVLTSFPFPYVFLFSPLFWDEASVKSEIWWQQFELFSCESTDKIGTFRAV